MMPGEKACTIRNVRVRRTITKPHACLLEAEGAATIASAKCSRVSSSTGLSLKDRTTLLEVKTRNMCGFGPSSR